MATIKIMNEHSWDSGSFEGKEYLVNTTRRFEGYEEGDLVCGCTPFFGVPLRLEIAIRKNGNIVFRSWEWVKNENWYLHTWEKPADKCESYEKPFTPTAGQIDAVSGLFSGRLKFEGLKLSPGGSLQDVCPIDIEKEEEKIGKKIYLA